ncbi:MAG: GNAT family N-acetyltransferase [Ruminococcaceae bacterium]|nr:GNAT family N-acetyltransferase [Oscillospiraceae bacterium]
MRIETPDLLLREMTPEDFSALHGIFSDTETMQYYPAPFDEQKTRGWIEWNMDNYTRHGFGLWAVVYKQTGEVIGDCGITLQNIYGDGVLLPEIGYHLRKDFWHRGLALQAGQAVLRYIFRNTAFDEIYCYQKWSNAPSRRLAERLGLSLRAEYSDPKNTRTSVYSVTRSEFDAMHQ